MLSHDELAEQPDGAYVPGHGQAYVNLFHSEGDPGKLHYVLDFGGGDVMCTCDGWRYNGSCWHVETEEAKRGSELPN